MNSPDFSTPQRLSLRPNTNNYPYTPSIAASASSSTSSVFSADVLSSQSSAPSSVKSTENTGWEAENPSAPPQATHLPLSLTNISTRSQDGTYPEQSAVAARAPSSTAAVAPELRLHPRRTQPTVPTSQCGESVTARPPPSLVRQSDRKDNFVESLVDTTTQMIEVIWPLSVVPCERDHVLGSKNLIGLRTFIQEVLKRSKTSYSTLQVALYYLVLIKPHIPRVDFTKEQLEDSHASRAMQCGRRMFLAALILASKYLQDRNYSARAWSKISGLRVSEINTNEIAFVKAVDWKLHIPEARFQLWTDVVLKFSLSPRSPPSSLWRGEPTDWRSIIPRLTPELDQIDVSDMNEAKWRSMSDNSKPSKRSMSPPEFTGRGSPTRPLANVQPLATPISKLQAMEPPLLASKENTPKFPPLSPRITQLPMPCMTPINFSIPAVSTPWNCHVKSMSLAMKDIQKSSMARSTVDLFPTTTCPALHSRSRAILPTPRRGSSLARSSSTVSTLSSPESMMSDVSSRSSRSSSISSVASSTGALLQPTRLAIQATRRNATMNFPVAKGVAYETILPPWESVWSSPAVAVAEFPWGHEESDVRHEPIVKEHGSLFGLATEADTAAAECLRELQMNGHCNQRSPPPRNARKRERPTSICDSSLQQTVRANLATALHDFSNGHGAMEGVVVADSRVAESFILDGFKLPKLSPSASPHGRLRSASGSREGGRKRTRCVEEVMNLSRPLETGPGMWAGIVL